jgi:hypothetical protein
VDSKDSLLGANQLQGFFWEAVLGVKDRLVLSDATWGRMAPLVTVDLTRKALPGATPHVRGRCVVDRAYGLALA